MATKAETERIILDKIHELATSTSNASTLLRLAEAFAWMSSPSNAHGSQVTAPK